MMKNRVKRFLLCLAAVSSFCVTVNIHAEDDNTNYDVEDEEAPEEEASSRTLKREEPKEAPEFTADDAKKHMKSAGTADGFEVFIRAKDYEKEIWKAHGFSDGKKPARKAELTDRQKAEKEAAEDEIDLVKKMGEGALINAETGNPEAELKKLGKSKDVQTYISDKGRFIAELDDKSGKLLSVRTVISVLDSPNVFLTDGGDTLELRSSDNKKVDELFGYSHDEDGKRVYTSEKNDCFAWVTDDMQHFLGVFRYAAENENFRMLVDDKNANIGLENKKTGYIWWSAPIEATQDTYATDLLVQELRSSAVMNYGVPLKYSKNNTLRSNTTDCRMKVSDIQNGIKVTYNYEKAGFSFPVEYTLEKDCLKASLKVDDIKESESANVATDITLLGAFGAASAKEDGYFVIPDGSGALVRFNNNRTMLTNAYNQKVYGPDVTAVPTSKGAVTEQIYLPVYGIVKEDNAMMVVAAKGDTNASLSVKASKQSKTSYNICNFSFTLRGTDTCYLPGNNHQEITVFEKGGIKSDDVELRYYPITKKNADYVDVAECYRNYLINEQGVKAKTSAGSSPLYVDFYGGALKKKPVLGIPVTMKTSFTDYSQAEDILRQLNDSGVDQMVVSYKNWTSDGIKNKVDTDAKPSWTLGGKKDFKKLVSYMDDNDIEFYPVSDDRTFYSGNGYYSFTDTAVRITGNYSRIVSYDRAYGIPDGFKKNMSLLSPSYFNDVFGEAAGNYSDAGLDGISVSDLTTRLYGDYGRKSVSRYDAMKELTESYEKLDDKLGNGMLADGANAYALPYVSRITGVPMTSSRFDVFDEDIPFYQIVMHGLIPYSTAAVNGDAEPEKMLLMAAATGSDLSFDMIYEAANELKDTEFDIYYYAHYSSWIDTAAEEYKLISPILSDVSDSFIVSHKKEDGGNIVTSTYSNGSVIKVDFDERTIEHNGRLFDLAQIEKEGGIKF